MTLIAGFIFVVGLTMRIIIGRKIFPCGLITFSFFTLPPAVMLPTVFRTLRIYLMYRINLQKMKLFDVTTSTDPKKINGPTITTTITNTTTNTTAANNTTIVTTIDQNTLLNNSNASSNSNSSNNSNGIDDLLVMHSMNSPKESNKPVVLVEMRDQDSKIFGYEDMSRRQEQISKVMSNLDMNNIEDIEMDLPNEWDDSNTDGDSESQADVSTWNMSEYKDMNEVKREVKKLTIMNFFLTKKFILVTYVIAFLIGVAIWVLLGIIEEVTYNSSTDPNKKRIFLFEGGLFVFDRGCGLTTTTVLVVGVHAIFYIFIEIVFLILTFMADRDTWGIKKETLILIIVQLIAALIFIVVGMLDITEKLLDYLVPTGLALWIYEYIEIFMCVGLPALYAIISDRRNETKIMDSDFPKKQVLKESGLEKVLKNRKTFKILLDFARRSYCTESVLCWRDIQRFKKSRKNQRKKAANHILNAYLTTGAPLELNMSKIEERKKEIQQVITENESKISHNLFLSVQEHCLNDMTDLFERLRSSNKEIANIVRDLKSSMSVSTSTINVTSPTLQ